MKKYILPLVFIVIFSCTKDLDDILVQEATDEIPENVQIIKKDDGLYSYLGLVATDTDEEITDVGCIEFKYPFILFQFDDKDEYVHQVSVLDNENFASILSNLQDEYSIGLSYPISGNLINGTPVSVNSNQELQQSIDSCIEQELEIILGDCNAIVEECIWKVTKSDSEETPYLGSFFTLRDDGSVIFSVMQNDAENEKGDTGDDTIGTDENENVEERNDEEQDDEDEFKEETGTWIFYFIGADLHMNINFGPIEKNENGFVSEQDTIKSDWNFDWKIKYIDADKIEIEKNYIQIDTTENGEEETRITEQITLEKECEEDNNTDDLDD